MTTTLTAPPSSGLLESVITLSGYAQVSQLNDFPAPEIVPAPGVGKAIVIDHIVVIYRFGTRPYASIFGFDRFGWQSATGAYFAVMTECLSSAVGAVAGRTDDGFLVVRGNDVTASTGAALTDVENQAVQVWGTFYNAGEVSAITSIDSGGNGYHIGDLCYGPTQDFELQVTGVDGAGGITGLTITLPGTNTANGAVVTLVPSGSALSVIGATPGVGGTLTVGGNHVADFAAPRFALYASSGGSSSFTVVSATLNGGGNTDVVVAETVSPLVGGDTLTPTGLSAIVTLASLTGDGDITFKARYSIVDL